MISRTHAPGGAPLVIERTDRGRVPCQSWMLVATLRAREVREVLVDSNQRVWVAEDAHERAIGFAAARLHPEHELGEIYMIAVDPAAQGQGVGSAMTRVATDWMRQAGMRVAMIETGGDRGHAPARRLYEKSGYTPLPAVRFFKSL